MLPPWLVVGVIEAVDEDNAVVVELDIVVRVALLAAERNQLVDDALVAPVVFQADIDERQQAGGGDDVLHYYSPSVASIRLCF